MRKLLGTLDVPSDQIGYGRTPDWYVKPNPPSPYKLSSFGIRLHHPRLALFKDHIALLSIRELATAEYWFYPPDILAVWYISQGVGKYMDGDGKWSEIISYITRESSMWNRFTIQFLEEK